VAGLIDGPNDGEAVGLSVRVGDVDGDGDGLFVGLFDCDGLPVGEVDGEVVGLVDIVGCRVTGLVVGDFDAVGGMVSTGACVGLSGLIFVG